MLPQRASLKRASKAADLTCAVGQFLKFGCAHCIVVVRSGVYSSAHLHNAMRRWVSHLEFLHVFTGMKTFLFGCYSQIVNNRNHLVCCRKVKAGCKHYRVHYICYYTNKILDVSSVDYISSATRTDNIWQ